MGMAVRGCRGVPGVAAPRRGQWHCRRGVGGYGALVHDVESGLEALAPGNLALQEF